VRTIPVSNWGITMADEVMTRNADTLGVAHSTVNPWFIAVTVTIAAFMELLDTSIANVALPYIGGGLGRSYDEVTWILTTYLVANAVVLPMTAWFSRLMGRKKYYLLCVVLFTVSSLFCGLAPSLGFMLAFRVLQGVGGGGLAPVAQAILVDTFPPAKRAAAFALFTVVIVTAPAVGPVLGGWITDNYSWRWIFFINVPVGFVSLYLSDKLVHDPPVFTRQRMADHAQGRMSVDGIGIVLITLASAALEIALDRGQIDDWFGSELITTLLIIALLGWTATVWWELRVKEPVIDFRLLANRNFAIASVLFFVFGIGLFGTTTMIPQMLQSLYGYRAIDAGLVLGPGALVITLLAPVSAQMLQRHLVSAKTLILLSLSFIALSMFVYRGTRAYESRLLLDSSALRVVR
jgi:DHA2 family multidrug resistance protein